MMVSLSFPRLSTAPAGTGHPGFTYPSFAVQVVWGNGGEGVLHASPHRRSPAWIGCFSMASAWFFVSSPARRWGQKFPSPETM